ncbi:MAG: efflux RND transporter permease subunit, partial [Bacteroidales bacterium]|nr:efflux RND transporter permease subunit [Bacteroidales bacterium]
MKNSFSIIASFIALTIIGATLVPLINLQLKPSRSLPTLNVSYSWYNASAKLIEQEVTSKLEGLFSAMKGVENISSVSSMGDGVINLEFKKEVDLDAARFELATLIRLAYPDLPEQVSYPSISKSDNSNETPPLLSYNLNASASPYYIQKFANKNIVPKLSLVKGINNIYVYGAMPNQWEITYNVESINSFGIEVNEISKAINSFLSTKIVGRAKLTEHENTEMIQVVMENNIPDEVNWSEIPIKKIDGRIVFLGDIAVARCKEKQPYSYFRINGLNTISIVVYPEKNINTLSLAADAKSKMDELKRGLPDGFSVILAFDASEDLNNELQKLGLRAIFSLVVLLLFVFLMSRQLKYLFLILISLISNLFIACIFYYVLKIEIHLYSL